MIFKNLKWLQTSKVHDMSRQAEERLPASTKVVTKIKCRKSIRTLNYSTLMCNYYIDSFLGAN